MAKTFKQKRKQEADSPPAVVEPPRTWVARVASAVRVGLGLALVYAVTLSLSAVTIGVLPQVLDGLLTIFVIPAGIPIGVAKLLLDRGTHGDAEIAGKSLGIGATTLWLPATLYFALLQPSVDLLWRPAWDGVGDPTLAGWIDASLAPDAAERFGTYTWTSSGTKTGGRLTSVIVAAPTTRVGAVDVWVCDVTHGLRDAGPPEARALALVAGWTGGGPVVRDAASVNHCDAAVAAAPGLDVAAEARPRVYVGTAESFAALAAEAWRWLGIYAAAVGVLWVGIPMGLAARR